MTESDESDEEQTSSHGSNELFHTVLDFLEIFNPLLLELHLTQLSSVIVMRSDWVNHLSRRGVVLHSLFFPFFISITILCKGCAFHSSLLLCTILNLLCKAAHLIVDSWTALSLTHALPHAYPSPYLYKHKSSSRCTLVYSL